MNARMGHRPRPDDVLGGLIILLAMWAALCIAPDVDRTILQWRSAVAQRVTP